MSVENKTLHFNEWDVAATLQEDRHGETGDLVRQLFYDPIITGLLGDTAGQAILDAGCGNGYFTRKLAQNARFAMGVDSSRELLRIAGKKTTSPNVSYFMMDLSSGLGFKDEVFDKVVSNIVLDYVADIDTFARESYRILKPNGTLVLGVQHPFDNLSRMKELKASFDGKPVRRKVYEGQLETTLFNRGVNDYIDPFVDSGFAVEDILEPEYPQELLEAMPEYQQRTHIPRFLFLKFAR